MSDIDWAKIMAGGIMGLEDVRLTSKRMTLTKPTKTTLEIHAAIYDVANEIHNRFADIQRMTRGMRPKPELCQPKQAYVGVFSDIYKAYYPNGEAGDTKETRECTGCNGKGEYQLMGPVTKCDVCGGTGVETIGEVQGAPPAVVVTDARKPLQRSNCQSGAVKFLFETTPFVRGGTRQLVASLGNIGNGWAAHSSSPCKVLVDYLESMGWTGEFEVYELLETMGESLIKFRRKK